MLFRSVMRVLAAKAHLGLATRRTVDLDEIHSIVNSMESNAVAQKICDLSVTLVRNTDGLLPLRSADKTAFFLLAEGPTSNEGLAFVAELKQRAPQAKAVILHSSTSDADLEAAAATAAGASNYVVAAFANFTAYRGSVALGGGLPKFLDSLIATGKPVALAAMGNPYMLRAFPGVAAYVALYSTVPPSEVSAVKALFGEIPVAGKLPVSIPGLAVLGAGLNVPARTVVGQ